MGRAFIAFALLAGLIVHSEPAAGADAGVELTRGEQTYAQFCAVCHGRYGRGDGLIAQSLRRPPPDFTDPNWLMGRSDQDIAKGILAASHGPMAMAEVLKPEVLVAAIAYTRTFSVPGKHVSIRAGRDIYNATCWQCHGITGDGKGPVVQFLGGAKPRDFTATTFVIDGREDAIVEFITVGAAQAAHGSPYMPEWSSRLSPQQIRDTVEYLKTFKQPAH